MTHCHTYIQALRQTGHRITPQREMIIETLAHSGEHMTAEEVFSQVQARARAVNLATIYRTLDLLVDKGLATRFNRCDGQMVYATGKHGPHLHLTCRLCGAMLSADSDLLDALVGQLQARYHFMADSQHLAIMGLCADCQPKS
jgi:Fur family ferric uptake transcriptional regulator